jgi:hypothetical protein
MSRYSVQVAREFGAKLPTFKDLEDAEEYWLGLRQEHLALLERLSPLSDSFTGDYTPQSLKSLERWYFELYETDSFGDLGISREAFETCMAMYLGEVVVRSAGAEWLVQEFAFVPGRYQMGVRKGLRIMMLWRMTDHYKTPNNKRRQSIYRSCAKVFT